eukprot:9952429-Ditylum_brightwellii.AAC.1
MGNKILSALQDDNDNIIMLTWWLCHCTQKEKIAFSRNRKAFFNAFPEDLKTRLCMKMRRHFVAFSPLFPWYKLFLSGDDAVLITTTGFHREGFLWLLQHFKEVYGNTTALEKYDYIIHPKERNGQHKVVRWHGLHVLYHPLGNQTTICLVMSTKDEFKSFVASIGEKYPRLAQETVYCAMDGIKLYLQQASLVIYPH